MVRLVFDRPVVTPNQFDLIKADYLRRETGDGKAHVSVI
jgi:hypothetical protein